MPRWLAALDACDGEQLRPRVAAARYLVASSSACAGSSPGLPLAPSASAMPVGHWTTESKPRRAAHGPVVPHADRATPKGAGVGQRDPRAQGHNDQGPLAVSPAPTRRRRRAASRASRVRAVGRCRAGRCACPGAYPAPAGVSPVGSESPVAARRPPTPRGSGWQRSGDDAGEVKHVQSDGLGPVRVATVRR
jgi:hypothetical protein